MGRGSCEFLGICSSLNITKCISHFINIFKLEALQRNFGIYSLSYLVLRNTTLHHTGKLEKSIQAQAGNTYCIALPEGMALEMISKASGVLMWVLC